MNYDTSYFSRQVNWGLFEVFKSPGLFGNYGIRKAENAGRIGPRLPRLAVAADGGRCPASRPGTLTSDDPWPSLKHRVQNIARTSWCAAALPRRWMATARLPQAILTPSITGSHDSDRGTLETIGSLTNPATHGTLAVRAHELRSELRVGLTSKTKEALVSAGALSRKDRFTKLSRKPVSTAGTHSFGTFPFQRPRPVSGISADTDTRRQIALDSSAGNSGGNPASNGIPPVSGIRQGGLRIKGLRVQLSADT